MKIHKILLNCSILILIIVLILVSYSKFIKKDYPVKIFGKSFLIVSTGSMKPTISAGELIIISEKENYEIGDIVTYIDEEEFVVTHRIVELDFESNSMITKGDNNNLNDEKISLDSIKGTVIFHSKVLGFIALYLLKPILIIYVFALIFIYLICNVLKEREENTYEEVKDVENVEEISND
jgi:signal peptidase